MVQNASDTTPSSIHWPTKFSPGHAPVHVANELTTTAAPAAVWAWLIRASNWPDWYSNSRDVRLPNGAKDLAPDMTFRWQTFGVRLVSQVREFVPQERLAWDARSPGVLAYHAWLIRPDANGCTIITEETQYGALARLGHILMPQRMHRGHQQWLEQFDRLASAGMPS